MFLLGVDERKPPRRVPGRRKESKSASRREAANGRGRVRSLDVDDLLGREQEVRQFEHVPIRAARIRLRADCLGLSTKGLAAFRRRRGGRVHGNLGEGKKRADRTARPENRDYACVSTFRAAELMTRESLRRIARNPT